MRIQPMREVSNGDKLLLSYFGFYPHGLLRIVSGNT